MTVTSAEVCSELNAIFRSRHFARSQRCCQFLKYVCDRTLAGDASEINEHLLGIEVFGRGSAYSPAEDAIVRRQAYALRYKLDEYYSSEGIDDEIRITLPTGHYVPVFQRRIRTGGETGGSDTAPKALVSGDSSWIGRRVAAAALVGSVLTLLGVWLVQGKGPEVSATSSKAAFPESTLEFWAPWLADQAGPLICLSNPMTTRVRQVQNVMPSQYMGRNFTVSDRAEERIRQWFQLSPNGYVYLLPSISQAKMGDALAAGAIANLLGRAGVGARFTQSRFLSWEDLRSESVILLGHPETNVWIEPLLQGCPFQVAVATGSEPARIVNFQAQQGESAEYCLGPPDNEGRSHEYSLISMLRSQDKRRSLLVIAGLSSQATQVAGEFLTDHSKLEEVFLALKAAAPTHAGPWLFQLVLKTSVRDKTPTGWGEIVALRVL